MHTQFFKNTPGLPSGPVALLVSMFCNLVISEGICLPFVFDLDPYSAALKYFCISKETKVVFLNLKSSEMFKLAHPTSFEYICNGSTGLWPIIDISHFQCGDRL